MYKQKNICVIGIDPGNVRAGFGVIKRDGQKLKYIKSGILNIKDSKKIGEQLYNLEQDLKKILKKYQPQMAGIEQLFFYKNTKTAIKVAEARGVIYKTLYENKVEIKELTPQQIKSLFVGNGRALKRDVIKIVSLLLKISPDNISDDEADALAIAILISQQPLLT